MKPSTTLIIGGLSAAVVAVGVGARALEKPVVSKCIVISHVGSEDSPGGTLRLCVGEKGRARADSLLENKWTFYFDAASYGTMEKFARKNAYRDPVDAGNEIEGSFSVTWPSGNGNDQTSYVLPTKRKCDYLQNLVHLVAGPEYAQFRQAGRDMMGREGCPSPSK